VLAVKDKGLVVISGCAHAGIINSIKFAQKLTGVQQVYAVIGGFHLTGKLFEPIIERTIDEMQKLEPRVVSPMHCTGYKAINRLRESFGERFVLNSVGTTVNL
jgi:7,8-dihydropterin-6-yl-methyl-4-(beta-D-ribofuranosyl)aminobenzene 5'-phosphate synthase